jgi:uncharacterized membrane protein (DUF485 family)
VAGHGHTTAVDWAAIERLPEFQELVTGRRRFAFTAGALGIGLGALYVVLCGVAPDLMGTELVGAFSLAFAGGVALVLVTWAITFAYLRRSNRVWGPLEERIREQTAASDGARFSREPRPATAREETQ